MNSHAKDVARSHGLGDSMSKRVNLMSQKMNEDQKAEKRKKHKNGHSKAAAEEKPEKSGSINPGFRRMATKIGTNKSKHLTTSSHAATN